MRYPIALAAALLFVASAHAQHRVECPAHPPGDLGAPAGAPLEQVAVLSEKDGVAIDDKAPPSLVPDRGFARGGTWHNVWILQPEPGWSFYIDCQYRGATRVHRLPAKAVRQCEQTATPYTQRGGVAATATHTLSCD